MRWFPFINLALASLIAVILFFTFFLVTPQKEAWTPPQTSKGIKVLPKRAFDSGCLDCLDETPFALKWCEPKTLLPDLQSELLYYGILERPDVPPGKVLIHLALVGEDALYSFEVGSPIYLNYKGIRSQLLSDQERLFSPSTPQRVSSGNYAFSAGNAPTSLWLETNVSPTGNLEVRVQMLDERGENISSPSHHHFLSLTPHEIPRLRSLGWEIDHQRVDSTLLIRQKARWIGQDRFLQQHGGETFAFSCGKERIDFLGDHPYTCFIQEGDFLTWREGRWKISSGEETLHQPLLVVKKIEERLISFELWDPEGKGKTLLTLVRSKDLAGLPNLEEEFKFIGAKTWAKFIVESHSERFMLKPRDWLVLTDDGWIQLDSAEKIDDYVENRLRGPLLILEKLTKENGRQLLVGHLFNTSRSEVEPVALATSSAGSLAGAPALPPPLPYNQFDFEDDLE